MASSRSFGRPGPTRLKLICAGTGRDGTQSLTAMLRKMFEDAEVDASVAHEYRGREFFHAFASYQETGDPRWMAEVRDLIDACEFDCIVGNGVSAILPVFAERCGPDLRMIHLQRADRAACIASLVKNCQFFPNAYGYYSDSPTATTKRMTAFHFREMSEGAWRRLPLSEKLTWYYDKVHALNAAHRSLFTRSMHIETEMLCAESTRRALAEFVLGDTSVLPLPAHLNAHIAFDWLPDARRPKVQWLMGRFNIYQAAFDDVFPLDYFSEQFIAWTGYQIRRSEQIGVDDYRTPEQIGSSLDEAERILTTRLDEIRRLREALSAASGAQVGLERLGSKRLGADAGVSAWRCPPPHGAKAAPTGDTAR